MVPVVCIILVISVVPALLDHVSSVGCSIDSDILRSRLHTALDYSLKELLLYLMFLQRQVIHTDDKLIVYVFNI